jgi:hypothetical protein
LCKVGEEVEETLPKLAHYKHFMGRIAVQEERLTYAPEDIAALLQVNNASSF